MIKNKLILPYKFELRNYQRKVFQEFFFNEKRRFLTVWHRRAGKDKTWLNLMIAASQLRKGTYIHMLPTLTQARKVIWQGIDKEGKRFLDHIPSSLIKGNPNNSEMLINLKNGSIIRLGGSDYYNAYMGTNPIGINFSEYSLSNPLCWHYLSPILRENNGWAAFNTTPRGTNHCYDLYNENRTNPDWFCNTLTVDDTIDIDGNPIITREQIEAERKSGMPEELIQQEYYCSFTSALPGAYFAKELSAAEKEGRICNFPIDVRYPVNTYWDIGVNDNTAIWLIQKKPDGYYDVIAYYENNNESLQHYINVLDHLRTKYGIVYNNHFSPHDGMKRDFSTGKRTVEFARDLGFTFRVVPRVIRKIDGINALRGIFSQLRIHAENCKDGLSCLREYHAKYNEKLNVYDEPLHNWAAHGADALMTFAQSYKDSELNRPGIILNAVNSGRIL